MISFKYELIFIHIPKTAGSSIVYSIDKSNWFKQFPNLQHKPAKYYKEYPLIQPFWDKFFKFSIIRNPFDRLVSNYFFKKENKNKTNKDFFNYVTHDIQQNINTLPISYWINEDLDYIGRFEDLTTTWKRIKHLSTIPRNRILLDFEYTATKNRIKDYRLYYTPLMVKKLRELWKTDLDLYNYDY